MKLHIGTDRRGVVHSLTATHAAEADIKQLPNLLHGEKSVLYGDQAYFGRRPTGRPSRRRACAVGSTGVVPVATAA